MIQNKEEMRVAILGGTDYVETAFEDWLYKLHSKYPDAIIHTGTAGGKNEYRETASGKKENVRQIRSAESMAASLMPGLGHTVWIPDMTTTTAKYLAGGSDLQLGWVLSGQWELFLTKSGTLQHRFITPRPDVIVAVGKITSHRAASALKHWKTFDEWREPGNRRPFQHVAAPKPAKKKKTYRATKGREATEQISDA